MLLPFFPDVPESRPGIVKKEKKKSSHRKPRLICIHGAEEEERVREGERERGRACFALHDQFLDLSWEASAAGLPPTPRVGSGIQEFIKFPSWAVLTKQPNLSLG